MLSGFAFAFAWGGLQEKMRLAWFHSSLACGKVCSTALVFKRILLGVTCHLLVARFAFSARPSVFAAGRKLGGRNGVGEKETVRERFVEKEADA